VKAKLIHAGVLFCGWLLCFTPLLRAASPSVSSIEPQGAQRGAETDITFTGERLQDAKGVLFYGKGVEVTGFEVVDDKHAKAKLKIAPDSPLGENQLRVWTATGISELHMFYIDPYPEVTEVEPNDDPAHAQPISLNVTVSGTITNEDVDCFSVEAKKGQRITAEVEGIRLGITLFDPWLGILKKDGSMLASCDDSSLLLQDPIVSIIAPEDGTYIIQLRDSTYAGSDKCKYRLHVGTFPQPSVVYPPGGPAGEELTLHFLGDVSGPIEKKITIPALENGVSKTMSLFAEQDGFSAPAGNPVRVSPFPNVLEVKPNNDIAHATKTDLPLPLAFNGIIAEKGDTGFFRFKAKKNETYDFRVYARALRSPIDSVLSIYDGQGKQLASNDDSGGPDSYLRFKIPADGEYCLSVTDQIKRGGPEFTYRVEVTPVQPELVLSMPQPVKDSQERETVVVPRGNRYGTVLRAKRSDFDGPLAVASNDLPPGMSMQVVTLPGNPDTIPVVFEATADAAVAGKTSQITLAPVDTAKKAPGRFEHIVELVTGDNNVYYQTSVDKLAVAVAQEAPFKLHIVEPKVPMVQNGSMDLKVAVERANGFTGPVEISMLYNPPGVSSQNSVKIPEGQNEGSIPLNAAGDAQPSKWQIAVIGSGDAGKGAVWVSSSIAQLEVSQPFVTAKIERGYVEQGQSATVTCKLTQNKPFQGNAKIQLLNLPNKVTAQDMEITSTDQEVQFPITADKGSSTTQRKDLFCLLTIIQDGEPIVHNIAQGGMLRVAKAVDKK